MHGHIVNVSYKYKGKRTGIAGLELLYHQQCGCMLLVFGSPDYPQVVVQSTLALAISSLEFHLTQYKGTKSSSRAPSAKLFCYK